MSSVLFIDEMLFPIAGLQIPCMMCGCEETVLEIDSKSEEQVVVLQTCEECEKTYELGYEQ